MTDRLQLATQAAAAILTLAAGVVLVQFAGQDPSVVSRQLVSSGAGAPRWVLPMEIVGIVALAWWAGPHWR